MGGIRRGRAARERWAMGLMGKGTRVCRVRWAMGKGRGLRGR